MGQRFFYTLLPGGVGLGHLQKSVMVDEFTKQVAIIVRYIREHELKISRETLADRSGVSYRSIVEFELNATNMGIVNVEKIARGLGTSLLELLARTSNFLQQRLAAVDAFSQSPWRTAEVVSDEEIEWLKKVPWEFCLGLDPPQKVLMLLVEARRIAWANPIKNDKLQNSVIPT